MRRSTIALVLSVLSVTGLAIGQSVSQSSYGEPDASGLSDSVSQAWTKAFELSPQAQPAAQLCAARFVAEALALPPVDPSLDPPAHRFASMKRAASVLELQVEAETALAQDPTLTDDERARVRMGCARLISVRIE